MMNRSTDNHDEEEVRETRGDQVKWRGEEGDDEDEGEGKVD